MKPKFADSVTSQQRAWWNEALSRMLWPHDAHTVQFNATVYTVDEPPCDGHGEYMCTLVYEDEGKVEFYIRTGADDPTQAFNAGVADDVKSFFMESVVHEYAHALTFLWLADSDDEKELVCTWFMRKDTGKTGQLSDWNPLDGEWADRIQEAIAEFFKDVWMPNGYRYFDNRTNWNFSQGYYKEFIDTLYDRLCPSEDPAS